MRKFLFCTSLALTLSAPLASANSSSPYIMHGGLTHNSAAPVTTNYDISIDSTTVVKLPSAASAVVIGNPGIADVSIHSSDTVFLVGRGYGNTNLVVLGAAGQTIMNADVNVSSSKSRDNVRVYNGSNLQRTTFNCAPQCEPAPVLGDMSEFISNNASTAPTISNTVATSSSPSSTATIGSASEIIPQNENE